MYELTLWDRQRFATLVVVLVLHLAVVALLVMGSRNPSISASTDHPVELMFIPPTKVPTMHAQIARPKHMSAEKAISLAEPRLDSPSVSAPASAADSNGPAVNWAAEAHRAVRAFEIRRDQPPNSATALSSPWDGWTPHKHHAGEQSRTASGDWIVWINASCYQVASWHSGAPAVGATPPPTVCRDESSTR
jgi:hypothetical protein